MTAIESANQSPGKVLILPWNYGGLRMLAILADAMLEDGRLEPCLVLTDESLIQKATEPEYARLPKVELQVPQIRVPWELPADRQNQKLPFKKLLLRACSKLIPDWAFEIWWRRNWYQQYYNSALELIRQTKPSAVVTIDDRLPGTIPMLKAARDMGVARLVVPPAISAFSKSLAAIRSTQPNRDLNSAQQSILKHWIAWRYPNQILKEESGNFLFYPASNIIALAARSMLPDNPFSVGGGLAQKVAVGEDDKKRLVQDGLDPSKIAVTGDPGLDSLYRSFAQKKARRAQLIERYGLNPRSKILLCAVPQFAEHGRVPWERHWRIVRELVTTLAGSGHAVVLSLHPKAEMANYLFLEEAANVVIVHEALVEILSCADIFIAGFSSTVRWAILGNVPTIVMDILNQDQPLFKNFQGIIHVGGENVFQALAKELDKLLLGPAELANLQQTLAREASGVAPFDGNANLRIIELIFKMAQMYNQHRC
jgi:hypothetical protein